MGLKLILILIWYCFFFYNKHVLKNLFLSVFGLDSFGPRNLILRPQSREKGALGCKRSVQAHAGKWKQVG
jgi:hypothetical protein